jgi:multicomponent Na+:H+ antiporter subunit D
MARTAPLIAVIFFVPAMSLAGIPPMSGFTAKFALFDSVAESAEWWILGVAVTVSLLTLFSIAKIWIGVFWAQADPGEGLPPAEVRSRPPWMMVAPTAVLVALTVALGVAAGPLYDYSARAAGDLLDPSVYISVVLEEGES